MSNTLTKLIESAPPVEEAIEGTELFIESSFAQQLTGRKWKVRIIKGDVQGSSAFYSKELLESHADVVKKGTRIYVDHMQPGERPERKAENLAGYFESDSYYENGDLFAEAAIFSDKIDWVKERAEAGMIGLSITGSGEVVEEAGRKVARTLDTIDSVDIVTKAGAGGEFVQMTESKSEEQEEHMAVTKEELTEALSTLKEEMTSAVPVAVKAAIEEALEEAQSKREKELEESAPEEPQGPTAAEISEALVEADLTAAGRKSVYAAVEAGTELEEAITAEKERETAILEEARGGQFGAGAKEEKKDTDFGTMLFG